MLLSTFCTWELIVPMPHQLINFIRFLGTIKQGTVNEASGRMIDADIEVYSVTGDPTALGVHFSGTRCDSLPLSYRVSVDLSAVIHN